MDNFLDTKGQKALIAKNTKTARDFIESLLDSKSFVETDAFLFTKNELVEESLAGEGVVTGYGTINDQPAYIYCQNYDTLKGGLGAAGAKKILKCMRQAAKSGSPLISVLHTAGARFGEGITALEGFAEIIAEAAGLKGIIPQIAVIKGECFGHMSYLAATNDFVYMMDGGAMLTQAPQVIAAKSGNTLTAKEIGGTICHFEKSGIANFSVKNAQELKQSIAKLFEYILPSNESVLSDAELNRVIKVAAKYDGRKIAADVLDTNSYFEINSGFEKATITAFGKLGGRVVGIIADSGENAQLTVGQIKKITAFVKTLDFYGIPMITLVNNEGVASCMCCEQDGLARKVARLIAAISQSDIAKISVVCGNAIGVGYTSLVSRAVGFDYALAWENAVVSTVAKNVGAALVYQDEITKSKNSQKVRDEMEKKYASFDASPVYAAQDGCIDNIISAGATRQYLISALQMTE